MCRSLSPTFGSVRSVLTTEYCLTPYCTSVSRDLHSKKQRSAVHIQTEGEMFVSENTVVMSNAELDWNNPETFTAMLDR